MTDKPLSHPSLEDSSRVHSGSQLDCQFCFAALPTAPSAVQEPYGPGLPHLMLPPGRTVPLRPDAGHVVESFIVPHDSQPGGTWTASCTCGWVKDGHYARDGAGPVVAKRLAETWAARHRANPREEA